MRTLSRLLQPVRSRIPGRRTETEGFDTYVGGVPAYSTLGYFSDPVLNTFLKAGETEVARLIFRELAHQMIFVEGDTAFNESFATLVENEVCGAGSRARRTSDSPTASMSVAGTATSSAQSWSTAIGPNSRKSTPATSPDASKRAAKAEVMQEIVRTYLSRQETQGTPPVLQKMARTGTQQRQDRLPRPIHPTVSSLRGSRSRKRTTTSPASMSA